MIPMGTQLAGSGFAKARVLKFVQGRKRFCEYMEGS